MAVENTVTIGTGQKLRNLAVTIIDPATNLPTTVLMEVVSIADSRGNIIDDFMDYQYQSTVLKRLSTIVLMLAFITGQDPNLDELL